MCCVCVFFFDFPTPAFSSSFFFNHICECFCACARRLLLLLLLFLRSNTIFCSLDYAFFSRDFRLHSSRNHCGASATTGPCAIGARRRSFERNCKRLLSARDFVQQRVQSYSPIVEIATGIFLQKTFAVRLVSNNFCSTYERVFFFSSFFSCFDVARSDGLICRGTSPIVWVNLTTARCCHRLMHKVLHFCNTLLVLPHSQKVFAIFEAKFCGYFL